MATEKLVNIGSGNGLLLDITKPLHEPVLTYHQWGMLYLPEGNLNGNAVYCIMYLIHSPGMATVGLIRAIQNIMGFGKPWVKETCTLTIKLSWIFKVYIIPRYNEIMRIFMLTMTPSVRMYS